MFARFLIIYMEGVENRPESIQQKEVLDYSFAFNECCFSDRILQLVMDPQEIRFDGAILLQEDYNLGGLQNSTENAMEVVQKSSSDLHDDNGAIEVRTVQVSSIILAESSQFFNKLSQVVCGKLSKDISVHISPSEHEAFIHLLKFMYGGVIETKSTKELLDVLIVADKFEVASCIHPCANALDNMTMTVEFATLVLCLPSSLLTTDLM